MSTETESLELQSFCTKHWAASRWRFLTHWPLEGIGQSPSPSLHPEVQRICQHLVFCLVPKNKPYTAKVSMAICLWIHSFTNMVIRRMTTNHPYTLEVQAPVRNRNEARQHLAETLKRLEDDLCCFTGGWQPPTETTKRFFKTGIRLNAQD